MSWKGKTNSMGFQELGYGKKVDETSLIWLQIHQINRLGFNKEFAEERYNAVMDLWRLLRKYRGKKNQAWFNEISRKFTEYIKKIPKNPKYAKKSQRLLIDLKWEYSNRVFEYCMNMISDKGAGDDTNIIDVVGAEHDDNGESDELTDYDDGYDIFDRFKHRGK